MGSPVKPGQFVVVRDTSTDERPLAIAVETSENVYTNSDGSETVDGYVLVAMLPTVLFKAEDVAPLNEPMDPPEPTITDSNVDTADGLDYGEDEE